MRLRVRHARERIRLCCVCLVRHVCECVKEEKVGGRKEEERRTRLRAAAARKVSRSGNFGFVGRRTDWLALPAPPRPPGSEHLGPNQP
jgi:hypothetical protein